MTGIMKHCPDCGGMGVRWIKGKKRPQECTRCLGDGWVPVGESELEATGQVRLDLEEG